MPGLSGIFEEREPNRGGWGVSIPCAERTVEHRVVQLADYRSGSESAEILRVGSDRGGTGLGGRVRAVANSWRLSQYSRVSTKSIKDVDVLIASVVREDAMVL